MDVVFVSNFLNHHQTSFCENMINKCSSFYFIATDNGSNQGYQVSQFADYVVDYLADMEKSARLIVDADVVIFGSCPNDLISLRASTNKLSFLYSERFFKKGVWRRFIPTTYFAIYNRILKYRNNNMYVLCASAYMPLDLHLLGYPVSKCFKWGYFPETNCYDIDILLKHKDTKNILWVGRFLDWKHPDDVLKVAKKLKDDWVKFKIHIVGSGEMENELNNLLTVWKLEDCVTFLGSLSHKEVRERMEKAAIFIFSSDRNEGWGAVLNESLNSGCAVVASHAIGSVPYMIDDKVNGIIYRSGSVNDLYKKVKYLLENSHEQKNLGKRAYETIANRWNAREAAERLIKLSEYILAGRDYRKLYEYGPCSLADIVDDDWFNEK